MKLKRILALLSIILLLGIYLCTLIFALMDSELSFLLFKASLLLTFIIPGLLYAMILISKYLKNKE